MLLSRPVVVAITCAFWAGPWVFLWFFFGNMKGKSKKENEVLWHSKAFAAGVIDSCHPEQIGDGAVGGWCLLSLWILIKPQQPICGFRCFCGCLLLLSFAIACYRDNLPSGFSVSRKAIYQGPYRPSAGQFCGFFFVFFGECFPMGKEVESSFVVSRPLGSWKTPFSCKIEQRPFWMLVPHRRCNTTIAFPLYPAEAVWCSWNAVAVTRDRPWKILPLQSMMHQNIRHLRSYRNDLAHYEIKTQSVCRTKVSHDFPEFFMVRLYCF